MLKHKLLSASAAVPPAFIEDVFSTYLYTGNGSTQTITNGIDLAGEGGLVWIKSRSAATDNFLFDTNRGTTKEINSNNNDIEATLANSLTAFNANGFSIGSATGINVNAATYVSWTFRQAPRFFDVVTYTGNGGTQTINHNLKTDVGFIVVKQRDGFGSWGTWDRVNGDGKYLSLNTTSQVASITPTTWIHNVNSSSFTTGPDPWSNTSGSTYVAYLFAHDPLGPSGDGSDGLIACGLHTQAVTGANELINLGWEPQWVLTKITNSIDDWFVVDNMRGFLATGNSSMLRLNLANAESLTSTPTIASNGFTINTTAGLKHIYIAIRRGPMREPTSGTEVFSPTIYTGTNVDNRLVNTGLLTDMAWVRQRNDPVLGGMVVGDRLRGQPYLLTGTTAAEVNDADSFDQEIVSTIEYGTAFSSHVGFYVGNDVTSKLNANTTSNNHIAYSFRRAPGFFDVVAYTGTGSLRTVSHNLGAAPDLMIIKSRNGVRAWRVYCRDLTANAELALNLTNAVSYTSANFNDTDPTDSVFTVNTNSAVNAATDNYIAYLFASLPGISKVGSYTGNGSTQTIDCGFTAGARFVLIKRTDTADAWYVWDSARGIVAGNDPYLQLNSTAAEVTSTDHIDPANSGFTLATGFLGTNNSAGTYIYLAIA